MSWPIGEVPPGWKRGRTLGFFGGIGPRHAVYESDQTWRSTVANGVVIEFDCRQDMIDWVWWWHYGTHKQLGNSERVSTEVRRRFNFQLSI